MRKRLPFLGPSYESFSADVSTQRTTNWYIELTQVEDRTRVSLLPMPGLKLAATVGLGPHRGAIEHAGDMYVVSGEAVFKIDTNGAQTEIGIIGTPQGRVSMATSGVELMITDGIAGYLWDGTTFATISDVDFVTPGWVVFVDGYFVVLMVESARFYISGLYDGSSWNALDFATAEVEPDDLHAAIVDHRELWLLGTYTTEVYYNSGNIDFPFDRVTGGFIEWGIAAPHSVAKSNGIVVWLARNRQGQGQVVAAQGFQPQVISNRALETTIAGYAAISDAFGWIMQYRGHTFYVLTFPSADATHIYDMTTGEWTRWKGYGLGRHRAATHCHFNGKHYIGDYSDGSLYTLETDAYKDNGTTIERSRRSAHIAHLGKRLFWSEVQIHFEAGVGLITGQGSNPTARLRWSDDGGHTWSNWHHRSIGAIGEYKARAIWRRLGSSRDRVFEISVSDPIKAVIVDAYAEVEIED